MMSAYNTKCNWAVSTSAANVCGIQDLSCIHMVFNLTSEYAEYSCIQVISRLTNPIRKDVSAKWPNWLPEGVVSHLRLRKVVHLPVAPDSVVHRCCRWRLPWRNLLISGLISASVWDTLSAQFIVLLRLAPVHGIVCLAALNARSDSVPIATANNVSIAIWDNAGYEALCECSCHHSSAGVSINYAGAIITRSNSSSMPLTRR
jgi:hypothetical protein